MEPCENCGCEMLLQTADVAYCRNRQCPAYGRPVTVGDTGAEAIPLRALRLCECWEPLWRMVDGAYDGAVDGVDVRDGVAACPKCGREYTV